MAEALGETVKTMTWRNEILILVACLTVSTGCLCRGVCTKRANEQCCPTDIRKTHFWCFGEDAIIEGPCGPKEELYGYEPTLWREFPPVEPTCDVLEGHEPLPPPTTANAQAQRPDASATAIHAKTTQVRSNSQRTALPVTANSVRSPSRSTISANPSRQANNSYRSSPPVVTDAISPPNSPVDKLSPEIDSRSAPNLVDLLESSPRFLAQTTPQNQAVQAEHAPSAEEDENWRASSIAGPISVAEPMVSENLPMQSVSEYPSTPTQQPPVESKRVQRPLLEKSISPAEMDRRRRALQRIGTN